MPTDAPAVKRAATEDYGAEVVLYDREREDREAIGRRLADERGLTVDSALRSPDIIAGQGTAALELIEEVGTARPAARAVRRRRTALRQRPRRARARRRAAA